MYLLYTHRLKKMRWKLNEYPRLIEGGEGLIGTRRGFIRVESNI